MKLRSSHLLGALALILPAALSAQKSTSDLLPPVRRQASVDIAALLTRPPEPLPVPADLRDPFNPPDFNQPDPSQAGNQGGTAPTELPGAPAEPARPAGDRDVLEMLAAQIRPTGMILLRNAPRLIISNKPFEVGTRFTVTYNGQDYELELTAIDRTTFTLRYRNEETTRPITPTK